MAASYWIKWLLVGALAGLCLSFPAPYDESEYKKLIEMMEVMAAGKVSAKYSQPRNIFE